MGRLLIALQGQNIGIEGTRYTRPSCRALAGWRTCIFHKKLKPTLSGVPQTMLSTLHNRVSEAIRVEIGILDMRKK